MVLGAIVLAFSHSKLKDVVGKDALRSVLSGQYRDLVQGSTLHLEPVWSLLESQPGFVSDQATAPFCLVKSWEKQLGVEVMLPEALKDLSASEIMAHGTHCPVPKAERLRLFEPELVRQKRESLISSHTEQPKPEPAGGTNILLVAALAVLSLGGIGFATYSFMNMTPTAEFNQFEVANLGSLPADEAKLLGREVHITIGDNAWFSQPENERAITLKGALEANHSAHGVDSLIVFDGSGALRASAQLVGDAAKFTVQFR